MLATCNRIEIYAEVDRFHGSVEDLTALLADRADAPLDDVVPALYVHYDEAAVAHLFSVAAGLDSMVVGEGQILGQVREALRDEPGRTRPSGPRSTRSSSRASGSASAPTPRPASTAPASPSCPSRSRRRPPRSGPLEGARVCIVGAGSIAALAAASVRRAGAGEITIVLAHPRQRPAPRGSVGGTGSALADLVPRAGGGRPGHLLHRCDRDRRSRPP